MTEEEAKPVRIYRIESCHFKRTEDSEYEPGLLLNEGDLGIIDAYGKSTGEIWTWKRGYEFVYQLDFFIKGEIL